MWNRCFAELSREMDVWGVSYRVLGGSSMGRKYSFLRSSRKKAFWQVFGNVTIVNWIFCLLILYKDSMVFLVV